MKQKSLSLSDYYIAKTILLLELDLLNEKSPCCASHAAWLKKRVENERLFELLAWLNPLLMTSGVEPLVWLLFQQYLQHLICTFAWGGFKEKGWWWRKMQLVLLSLKTHRLLLPFLMIKGVTINLCVTTKQKYWAY